MDFKVFDELLDGETSTILVKKVGDAISDDIKLQRRKVSRTKYNKWIDQAYDLSNSTALRYGHTMGQKLIDGVPLAKGNGYIKGSDLGKIVYYALRNDGRLSWLNLRSVLEEAGEPISRLLLTEPLTDEDLTNKINRTLQDIGPGLMEAAGHLREIADIIEPLATSHNSLEIKNKRQGLIIVNQSNAIMEQQERIGLHEEIIEELKKVIHRMKSGIETTKSPKDAKRLRDEIENLEKRLVEVTRP